MDYQELWPVDEGGHAIDGVVKESQGQRRAGEYEMLSRDQDITENPVAQGISSGYCLIPNMITSFIPAYDEVLEGEYIEAEGEQVEAEGDYVEAEGDYVEAEGNYVEAEGNYVEAEGEYIKAEEPDEDGDETGVVEYFDEEPDSDEKVDLLNM